MEKKVIAEEKLKEKTRKLSIKEGCFYSVHDGFGLRYVTPYALEIGKNNPYTNTYIGLLTSIPSLIGNLSQLWTAKLMEKYSRKTLVRKGVMLQALMWLGVIFAGICFFIFHLNSNLSMIILLFFYTFLTLFGSIISPVWVSWMKDTVTSKNGEYFGRRNKIIGIVALSAMLIGGFILDYFKPTQIFFGFAVLFFISFISRSTSGLLFKKHYETELKLNKEYYFSFKDFIRKIPTSNFAKFSLFAGLIIFATSIASPFFSVYMLNNLNFNYIEWIIIIVSSALSQILFMPIWGMFIDKYGRLKALQISGALIPLVPLLWVTSKWIMNFHVLFAYLLAIEFLSGIAWAGFNLASTNFIYAAITRERTAICSAYFNVLQGIGIFVGATIGGIIASQNFIFIGLNSLLFIFLISGILRIVIYIAMISKINEVKPVEKFNMKKSLNKFKKNSIQPFVEMFSFRK